MGIEMDFVSLLAIVSVILIAFEMINEKWLKLPTEIGFMSIAFLISLIILMLEKSGITALTYLNTSFEKLDLNEIIMNGFLCYLIFSGSAKLKITDLAKDKYLIIGLSFFSTFVSALIYAGLSFCLAKLVGVPITFFQACMFGSIVAPTDPVSAMSILNKAGLSERLSKVMEGEALFNDGVAVALLLTFSGLHSLSGGAVVSFFESVLVGIVGALIIGFVIGKIFFTIFRSSKYHYMEVLSSVGAVSCAYSLGDHLKVSGPIAAVVVGIYYATKMHKEHHNFEQYYSEFYTFWNVIDKFLNGVLYTLMGFSVLFLHDMKYFWILLLGSVFMGLVARYISTIVPVITLYKNTQKDVSKKDIHNDRSGLINLLTWGGLKGGICIALALGTSNTLGGEVGNYILIGTYGIVLFSTLVQGLSIGKYYSKIKDRLIEE